MAIFSLFGQYGAKTPTQIGIPGKFGASFKTSLGMSAVSNGSIVYQKIGEYQGSTFISPADSIAIEDEINNSVYRSSTAADIISPDLGYYKDIDVNYIPNRAATLNLRVSDLSPIRVSSCRVYLHEGSSTGVSNSFYDVQWYECIHISTNEGAPGSGAASWSLIPASSTGSIVLRTSPGPTGFNPVPSLAYNTRHDWFFCLSLTPAKTFTQSTINISCMIDYV